MEKCYYCGKVMTRHPWVKGVVENFDQRTKDHIVPKILGGKGKHNNTVICCFQCNVEKGMLSQQEFRAVLAFRQNKLWIKPLKVFHGEKFKPPKPRDLQLLLPDRAWKKQVFATASVLAFGLLFRVVNFVRIMN